MRITYVARSFLDYRLPVLAELDKLCGGQLHYISSVKWNPQRVRDKVSRLLGDRAILLRGERSIGVDRPAEANKSICIPYQPGLLRTIRQTKPDVVVGDGFFRWTYAPVLCRLLHGVPLVVCYERWAHTERNAQWYRTRYRNVVLRFTDAMSCNGTLCVEYVRSLGFPAERITTGHMAADTEALGARAKAIDDGTIEKLRRACAAKGILFLYVGRLIKSKGLDQLLDGWRLFERQHAEEGTLLVAGAGPEEGCLRSKVLELGLRGVRFAGAVDYDGLAPYYAASDCFVIPTLEDNWSLVVPEAMACGLPILCSKYNGCWPELVTEGKNGSVFDPLDADDTLRCLRQCLANRTRLVDMGSESRRIVAQHSPRRAAEAIHLACLLGIEHHDARSRPSTIRQS